MKIIIILSKLLFIRDKVNKQYYKSIKKKKLKSKKNSIGVNKLGVFFNVIYLTGRFYNDIKA